MKTKVILIMLAASATARGQGAPLEIPHEQFRLDNGLNVILHHDPRLPRVAVNLLYRVGAKDDPAGRAGMAHLFEHLMFMGTKRVKEKQIDLIMEQAGGWNNAYTSHDITVYYDLGPSRLLQTLLWLEADRMATLAQAMVPKKLKLQQDVVVNELRQSYENAPYGKAHLQIPRLMYPRGHSYSWPIIGSVDNVRATTVAEVKRFFARYYSPANASLVVAGRFDPRKARQLVKKYFGWIPKGPPIKARALTPSKDGIHPFPGKGEIRRTLKDKVKLPRYFFVWHSPALLQPGDAEMDLAAEILSTGKQSRLHRELVFNKKLALDVEAYQDSRQLGSQFLVEVTARQGVDPGELKKAVDAVLQGMVDAPPTARELRRAITGFETQFVTRLERLQRRAELLNVYFTRTGKADYAEQDLKRYRQVTPQAVHRWCKKVLRKGRRLSLLVLPEGKGP